MNRRTEAGDDRLDRIIERWMSDDAPPRAPDHLLAEMRVAASAQGQGAGGAMKGTLAALAAAAVVLLAVLLGTGLPGLLDRGEVGTDPSPSPSRAASISASPTPDTPSPAPTATPSPSATAEAGPGEPLMSFTPACDVTPPVLVPATTVMEDGRVVWQAEDRRHLVRRLTSHGLAQLREEVRATGLFTASATYELERRPGTPEPPGHGVCVWSFAWSDGDAPTVEVRSVQWLGDEEEAAYYEPSPERETLDALAERLREPERIDEDAWAEPVAAPYEPHAYLVLAALSVPQLATEGAPDLDEVAWPFESAPDAFGTPTGGQPAYRCGVADAGQVRELADQLAAAGLEQFSGAPSGATVLLPWVARDASVDVSIWPVMPDGRPTCESIGE